MPWVVAWLICGASESNLVQPPPYGIVGTKTPGEVQEDREAGAREANEFGGSIFDGRMGAPDVSNERDQREPPEPEKE